MVKFIILLFEVWYYKYGLKIVLELVICRVREEYICGREKWG